MPAALITGATSGIGAAFARRLARQGVDLTLVARDAHRLGDLAQKLVVEHGITCDVMPADLASPMELLGIEQRLRSTTAPIDLLVNNAGLALNKAFTATSATDEDRLLDVMVRATMRLTHAAVPAMVGRGHGAVINVSSIAAWIPGSTYGAAKAWVTSFSEGLDGQLEGTGVRVMALCPGYVRTEFHERADIDTSGIPSVLWLNADDVVAAAMRDLNRGRSVSLPGALYKVLAPLARISPRPVLRAVAARRPGGRSR